MLGSLHQIQCEGLQTGFLYYPFTSFSHTLHPIQPDVFIKGSESILFSPALSFLENSGWEYDLHDL